MGSRFCPWIIPIIIFKLSSAIRLSKDNGTSSIIQKLRCDPLRLGFALRASRLLPPQVWMCIGRNLKPVECPGSDRRQCRDVVIPRMPSSTSSKDAIAVGKKAGNNKVGRLVDHVSHLSVACASLACNYKAAFT